MSFKIPRIKPSQGEQVMGHRIYQLGSTADFLDRLNWLCCLAGRFYAPFPMISKKAFLESLNHNRSPCEGLILGIWKFIRSHFGALWCMLILSIGYSSQYCLRLDKDLHKISAKQGGQTSLNKVNDFSGYWPLIVKICIFNFLDHLYTVIAPIMDALD